MGRSSRAAALLAVYDGINSGDFEAVLGILDPEVEFVVGGEPPVRGIAAVTAYMRRLPETLGQLSYKIDEVRENDAHVLLLVRSSARGLTSGITTEASTAHLWQFRGDTVVHFRIYAERGEGIAAFSGV